MGTSAKPAAPAAQSAFAKKAAAAKDKAKPAGLPASLIAAERKHRTRQARAGTPDTHFEHDQTRVPTPRVPPDIRLLSKPEVLAIANVTYPTLWAWMRNGTFPRSRVVGGRSMWLSTEVEAWLTALPIRPLKGDGERDWLWESTPEDIDRLLAEIATAPDEAYIVDLVTNSHKATAALSLHERERTNAAIQDAVREWREVHAS